MTDTVIRGLVIGTGVSAFAWVVVILIYMRNVRTVSERVREKRPDLATFATVLFKTSLVAFCALLFTTAVYTYRVLTVRPNLDVYPPLLVWLDIAHYLVVIAALLFPGFTLFVVKRIMERRDELDHEEGE